ncbi:MAG: hypothetical protein WCR27_09670 [Eubacteriales bacterium]
MDQAIEFLKAMLEDNELQANVKKAMEGASDIDTEVAAVTDLAVKAGFNVSAESLKATVLQMKKANGELSDDDLENVAGGASRKDEAGMIADSFKDALEILKNSLDRFFGSW